MTTHLESIHDLDFDSQVLASDAPYLLAFSAAWCAPCRALHPILEQIAAEYPGRVRIGTIDIDASPVVAAQLGIRGAPTLILFRGGRECARQLGLTDKRALLRLLGLSPAGAKPELERRADVA